MLQRTALLATLVALVACSTIALPPNDLKAEVAVAMQNAQTLGAPTLAPLVWAEAQQHWQEGLNAMRTEHYAQAQMALEKALADAELASATSQFERLNKTMEQTQE